jgi:hypothetical protein
VKGFLSFNPLAFTRVPPDVTISKECEDSIFGNSVGHCVYKIYGEELATFGYVLGVFPPTEI